jgi:hypothetical protein
MRRKQVCRLRLGNTTGRQPRGRWFKLSWEQRLFVGGNVRLGYVRLGVRDREVGASFFSSFFYSTFKKIGRKKW